MSKRPELTKSVGKLGFFCLAFGSMIGVGWVTALGSWLENAGPMGAVIAFALGGLLMILIGLCYAEVTPMLPLAGGEVAYAYKGFGMVESFVVGWFLAFGYLSVSAFEAISVSKVLGYLIPDGVPEFPLYQIAGDTVDGIHILLALVFTALITFFNYKGVQNAIRLQVFLTLILLLASVIFISVGFVNGSVQNLEPLFVGNDFNTIAVGIMAVFVTVPFWFVGFDTIPQSAEEADSAVPPRSLGRLIILSIVASVIFYGFIIMSASFAAPYQSILKADLPTAAAFEAAFGSAAWAKLVLVAALIGLLTSWNGFFLAGSRVLFALGRGKIIAPALGKTHSKYGSPVNAVWFAGIFTFAASLLGRSAMLNFVNVGSLCIVIAFLGVSMSFLRLRQKFPKLERPYKLPFGNLVGILAAIGSLFILALMVIPSLDSSLSKTEWYIFGLVAGLGLLFWIFSARQRNSISEKERSYLVLDKFSD